MSENAWLAGQQVEPLLDLLGESASPRKLRLFGVACARMALPPDPDADMLNMLATVEQFADGTASRAALKRARAALAERHPERVARWSPLYTDHIQTVPAWHIARKNPRLAALVCSEVCLYSLGRRYSPSGSVGMTINPDIVKAQVVLLRDIFGNPSRPAVLSETWRTSDAVGLARSMYDSRDFVPMPILADALEDAGCDSADILGHCRAEAPHVRGCWVVDQVLGKS
jgi:hypothetical protein